MSNAIFPVLPGLSWSVTKTPMFSTRIQESVSGRELRAAYFKTPRWRFSLSYDVLRATAEAELQELMGFYNLMQGSFESFLYRDPSDNAVAASIFDVSDGIKRTYFLTRKLGQYVEPIAALQDTPKVFIDAVETTAFTVDLAKASITFSVAPAAGKTLTWTGGFYYRVRFANDELQFDEFMKNLWQAKKVELISVKE